MCDGLWYLMCLSARLGPTLDNALNLKHQHSHQPQPEARDPNTIFCQVAGIYVIVLLHSYLKYSDGLMLKEM